MAKHCLVLNNAFQPLGGILETDAIELVATGDAEILKADKERPYRSQHLTIFAPLVIALNHYVDPKGSFQYRPKRLDNRNLFIRDGFICQYCGRSKKSLNVIEKLTRDHIIPLSRGGRNVWDNVTTACSTCNSDKDDRTPQEAGMKLLSAPKTPIDWVIRGKANLSRKQIQYAEEVLGMRKSCKEGLFDL